jgi:hypothetical protein
MRQALYTAGKRVLQELSPNTGIRYAVRAAAFTAILIACLGQCHIGNRQEHPSAAGVRPKLSHLILCRAHAKPERSTGASCSGDAPQL